MTLHVLIDRFQFIYEMEVIKKLRDFQKHSDRLYVILTNEAINTTEFPIPSCYIESYLKEVDNYAITILKYSAFKDKNSIISEIKEKYPQYDDIKIVENLAYTTDINYFDVLPNDSFRLGLYAATQHRYASGQPTVDVLIRYEDKILLGYKNKLKKYVLCGGFYDVEDDSFEESAIRETLEETNLIVDSPRYLFSHKINDIRYQNSKDRIITTVFKVEPKDITSLKASDDLDEVKWFTLKEIEESNEIFNEHKKIILRGFNL